MPLTLAVEALSTLCDGAGVDYFNGWRIICKNPLLTNIFFFFVYLFNSFLFFVFLTTMNIPRTSRAHKWQKV